MSKGSSFREKLAQRASMPESDQTGSSFPIEVHIARTDMFPHPVALAKLLRDNGMRLAEAHEAVSLLANEGHVTVLLYPDDVGRLLSAMRAIQLEATVTRDERVASAG